MTPADLTNRALDSIGVMESIGDLNEGTRQAQVALRHYGSCMRQIFRSAHWNFARKRCVLTLLQDATLATQNAQIAAGLTPTVGNGSPSMRPWMYEYAWPVDAIKARYIPMSANQNGPAAPVGNIAILPNPLFSGMQAIDPFIRPRPAPFLVTTDNIPTLVGAITDWSQEPDTSQTMGHGLSSQTVILTNQRCAELVYTALITQPDQWDPLFQQAFVSLLASYLAAPLVEDRKSMIVVRDDAIKVAKMALDRARIADGNEGVYSTDHTPDWMRKRTEGDSWNGFYGYGGAGGNYNQGWDSCCFGDGSYY